MDYLGEGAHSSLTDWCSKSEKLSLRSRLYIANLSINLWEKAAGTKVITQKANSTELSVHLSVNKKTTSASFIL